MILQCSVLGSKSEETHSVHLIRQILNYALLHHAMSNIYASSHGCSIDHNTHSHWWHKCDSDPMTPNTQTKCESLSQEGLHTHNSITAWKVIPRLNLWRTALKHELIRLDSECFCSFGEERVQMGDSSVLTTKLRVWVSVTRWTRPAVCSRSEPQPSPHTQWEGGHKARPQQELVNKSYGSPGGSWPWSAEGPDMRGGGSEVVALHVAEHFTKSLTPRPRREPTTRRHDKTKRMFPLSSGKCSFSKHSSSVVEMLQCCWE